MVRSLTREDIVAVTGEENLADLRELEIIFLGLDEIGALHHCPGLVKLRLLDNGLKIVSNLAPVAMTLQSLTICDQEIRSISNLSLPHLRELFIHRNQLSSLDGLAGCPRLQRLWAFQNTITDISALSACTELNECWLQANSLTTLQGVEHCSSLRSLGLAGNPIVELTEVRRLESCTRLQEISFSDIHFGRCPIAEERGFTDFLLLNLRSIRVLDGVSIARDAFQHAEETYLSELTAFNNALRETEEDYQQSLRALDTAGQSREPYSVVLEREMATALRELHALVDEGRSLVSREISATETLLESNFRVLCTGLESLESRTEMLLSEQFALAEKEEQETRLLIGMMERVETTHSRLMEELAHVSKYLTASESKATEKAIANGTAMPIVRKFAYQPIGSNAADFLFLSSCFDSGSAEITSSEEAAVSNGSPQKKSSRSNGKNEQEDGGSKIVELARLYKIAILPHVLPHSLPTTSTSGDLQRLFAVFSVPEMRFFLASGWSGYATALQSTGIGKVAQIFSDDPSLLALMFEEHAAIVGENPPLESLAGCEKELASVVNESQVLVLLSFTVSMSRLGLTDPNVQSTIDVSSSPTQRLTQISDLEVSTHPAAYTSIKHQHRPVNFNHSTTVGEKIPSHLYTVPLSLCDQATAVEFACVALRYPAHAAVKMFSKSRSSSASLAGNPLPLLRSLEARLETLSLPCQPTHASSAILTEFENNITEEVRRYVDNLLEEVDEATANILRQNEKDGLAREIALKNVRDDVERERSGQEIALRELRNAITGEFSNAVANSNHTSSNQRLPQPSRPSRR